MNILVIGGTRLLGRCLVRVLLAAQHQVTVLSRRTDNCPAEATCLGMDRSTGLAALAGRRFDSVVDFLAYDGSAAADALAKLPDANYVLISSVWLTRLQPGLPSDQPVIDVDQGILAGLPAVTRSYLLGKREAESVLFNAREQGRQATALRLPIFFGTGDHTGRLEFYRSRIRDGGAVICVDGGHNRAQVAWTEDIARAFVEWLPFSLSHAIWDGLAGPGSPVREIIASIAEGSGRALNLVDVPADVLSSELPLFLEHEPLWRETPVAASRHNIFTASRSAPTPPAEWLGTLRGAPDRSPPALREMELALIARLKDTRSSV